MSKKSNQNQSEETIFHHRFTTLVSALGISERKFSKSIGKSLSYIGTVGDDIALGVALKILNTYPSVNKDFLFYGEGEPLLSQEEMLLLSSESPLVYYLEKKTNEQEQTIRNLHREIGRLEQIIEGKKDYVQQVDNVMDVAANQ